jgi:hypothetical protein
MLVYWRTAAVGVLDLDAGRRLHLVGIGCGHRLGTIPHELLDPAVHALEVEAVDAARREGIGRDPLELVTVGDVIFRQAQRLPPLLRGQQRRFDGAEQLLQRHAVQRLGPLLEREGSALPHPGELVLQLAQLPIGVVQVRVLRSLLRRQGAVLLGHPVLGHPHGRRTAAGAGADDRDAHVAENGELLRLLHQTALPPREGPLSRAPVADEAHRHLDARHGDGRSVAPLLLPSSQLPLAEGGLKLELLMSNTARLQIGAGVLGIYRGRRRRPGSDAIWTPNRLVLYAQS